MSACTFVVAAESSGRKGIYWELVESYPHRARPSPARSSPTWSSMSKPEREGFEIAIQDHSWHYQYQFFEEDLHGPKWVEIDTQNVRVERTRAFGGPCGLEFKLIDLLGLTEFLWKAQHEGREDIAWRKWMTVVLVVCRLCHPSSELYIANHLYERLALEDLLGLPAEKITDDRPLRAPWTSSFRTRPLLKSTLKDKLGTLFDLKYDLLLYDVTSTYIEGVGAGNEQMKRRVIPRDQRPDSQAGLHRSSRKPRTECRLAIEVFDGNRTTDVSYG